MCKNRNITFGYAIENGNIIINPTESEIVKTIFNRYINGESFKQIAESMTQQGCEYRANTHNWNKNMVKRIIDCDKYIGTDDYLPIIDSATFHQAVENKTSRCTYKRPEKETETTAPAPAPEYTPTLEVIRLGKEIGRELDNLEVDKNHIKSLIMQCASKNYDCCHTEGSTEC